MALLEEIERQGNWLFKYRSHIPLFVLILGIFLHVRAEKNPDLFLIKDSAFEFYYEILALLVGLAGLLIRVYTVGYTPKKTSGRNTKEGQVADKLNTTGIYSIVRHPLYLGNFLMWFGPAMLTCNLWFLVSFSFFYWVYYERIMFAEEQFLRKKFGNSYLAWAAKTPPFIPKIAKTKKSNLPFSWKKVLMKEKNGLFALFFIFCLFDIVGELIKGHNDYNILFMFMCILSGIGYLTLKIIKRKTSLLHEPER